MNEEYYSLLKAYLSEILFQGKPIIINKNTGFSLMMCVSNALAKTPVVPVLSFESNIFEDEIDRFLSQDERIVCLDNFIGNFNETILMSICDRHKDKIIFLTVAYNRTLCYVPTELMQYCHYINLNRIEAFIGDKVLTEAPSIVDEIEILNFTITPEAKWSSLLKEILNELGFPGSLSAYKSSFVTDEFRLCCILAFDVLPYCVDVLRIAPFNLSDRLGKYAGESGRCHYRSLFARWFT